MDSWNTAFPGTGAALLEWRQRGYTGWGVPRGGSMSAWEASGIVVSSEDRGNRGPSHEGKGGWAFVLGSLWGWEGCSSGRGPVWGRQEPLGVACTLERKLSTFSKKQAQQVSCTRLGALYSWELKPHSCLARDMEYMNRLEGHLCFPADVFVATIKVVFPEWIMLQVDCNNTVLCFTTIFEFRNSYMVESSQAQVPKYAWSLNQFILVSSWVAIVISWLMPGSDLFKWTFCQCRCAAGEGGVSACVSRA